MKNLLSKSLLLTFGLFAGPATVIAQETQQSTTSVIEEAPWLKVYFASGGGRL